MAADRDISRAAGAARRAPQAEAAAQSFDRLAPTIASITATGRIRQTGGAAPVTSEGGRAAIVAPGSFAPLGALTSGEAGGCDEAAIAGVFGASHVEIHHIGGAAIPGVPAKPIVGLPGIVPGLTVADAKVGAPESLGYPAKGAHGMDGRRHFHRMDRSGARTHHLHMLEESSAHMERHPAFRECRITHPDPADDHSRLKDRRAPGENPTWRCCLDGEDPFLRRDEPQAVAWVRSLNGN